jgi:hypothetical protein
MIDKYTLKQQLQGNVATVVFTKADGTERTMRCTLVDEYLPDPAEPQLLQENTRAENPNVLSVWDIENGGWRSFRLDSIKSVSVGA